MHPPVRVLFVCLGNICRSPLAEFLFRHHAERRGVADRFRVASAGTSGWHDGEPPDARSAATALRRGVAVGGTSRRLAAEDFGSWDLLVAMDGDNLAEICRLAAEAGAEPGPPHRLREWDPCADDPDVPDPYFGGEGGFDRVHDIIDRSAQRLLVHLLRVERSA